MSVWNHTESSNHHHLLTRFNHSGNLTDEHIVHGLGRFYTHFKDEFSVFYSTVDRRAGEIRLFANGTSDPDGGNNEVYITCSPEADAEITDSETGTIIGLCGFKKHKTGDNNDSVVWKGSLSFDKFCIRKMGKSVVLNSDEDSYSSLPIWGVLLIGFLAAIVATLGFIFYLTRRGKNDYDDDDDSGYRVRTMGSPSSYSSSSNSSSGSSSKKLMLLYANEIPKILSRPGINK